MANPRVHFVGAREGADLPLLGYVVAWFAADEGEIANLAVAPDVRSRGIGAAPAFMKAFVAAVQRRREEKIAKQYGWVWEE